MIQAYEDGYFFRDTPPHDHPLSAFSRPTQQLVSLDNVLYVVEVESGEILHYDSREYLLDGGIVQDLHLSYSTADTARSKQAHREYSNTLGDLPGKAAYNGIKEFADVLSKPDFTKVFALCNEVDRRNLAFITRADLCAILNTTPDHLNRVLSGLERKKYIKVDKAEHQKGVLKVWVNPSFVWKGDLANRYLSGHLQGFPILERKRPVKRSEVLVTLTATAMAAYDVWHVEHGQKANQPYSNEWYAEITMYDSVYGEGVRLAAENQTLSRLLNPATSEADFICELFTPAQYQAYLQMFAKLTRRIH
ncbi:helix-turn-helix domain-containing protein [Klebsiella michiganensis]|uniref:helix-turn-helix domain-containing protein n=1 Tax=Klebsiella michiganensis TaxID=1134687 RepID=UPI001CCE2B2B|nr:helix-turn-helix domain-containing protein [Klebsiella michiganensis]MBZ7146270.1 winged helix-turn-helix domain-containing protein [Klebsiella michiganensis]